MFCEAMMPNWAYSHIDMLQAGVTRTLTEFFAATQQQVAAILYGQVVDVLCLAMNGLHGGVRAIDSGIRGGRSALAVEHLEHGLVFHQQVTGQGVVIL